MIANIFRRGKYWQANLQLETWPTMRRVSLRTVDKRIAQAKLVKLVQDSEKEAAGLMPPLSVREAAQRPFLTLVETFLADLTARQKSENTVRIYRWVLRKLHAACGWNHLRDVTAASFCAWRAESALSGKTINDHQNAVSRFFRWLKRQRLVLENPLDFVELVDTRATAREVRRALTSAEVLSLLEAAPYPRRLVYRMALETGLRRKELGGLRWADLLLGNDGPETRLPEDTGTGQPREGFSEGSKNQNPDWVARHEVGHRPGGVPAGVGACVRVCASVAKNRRTVLIPLGAELAAQVRAWRAPDAASFQMVFPSVPTIETLVRDLNKAGIPFVDEIGRRVDFHSLRKTFGTALVLSGVLPRVVMELMRHSDLKLTMKLYMDAQQLQGPGAEAVAQLPWNRPAAAEALTVGA